MNANVKISNILTEMNNLFSEINFSIICDWEVYKNCIFKTLKILFIKNFKPMRSVTKIQFSKKFLIGELFY